MVADTGWFFDTELLVLAEHVGMRIHEVPVDWVDDPDSRVDALPTAIADLKGVWRLTRGLATGSTPVAALRGEGEAAGAEVGAPIGMLGHIMRSAAIGVASTLVYLVLFVGAREAMPSPAANAVALLLSAIANTAVNRRLTLGIRGPDHVRHQAQGLAVFLLGLGLTSGSLYTLHSISGAPSRTAEVAVDVIANLATSLVRFLLFGSWMLGTKPMTTTAVLPAMTKGETR